LEAALDTAPRIREATNKEIRPWLPIGLMKFRFGIMDLPEEDRSVPDFHQGPSRRIARVVIEERGTHVLHSSLPRHHPR
jgi:hypothetical protein